MEQQLAHSDFLVFGDESGDHNLKDVDPSYPVFVLAFCVFRKDHYAGTVIPALTNFKFRHFGHDQVVLHEREIRKDLDDFAILREPTRKQEFLAELTDVIAGLEFTAVAAVIQKHSLKGRYAHPPNPYEIALKFGLERIHMKIRRQKYPPAKTMVVLERRGQNEDDQLELEFRRICDGGSYDGKKLDLEPRFVKKAANAPGLQLADLIARPIGRFVMNQQQPNRAFEVIKEKLDKSPKGDFWGWGLKVFP